jgi:hypothetical protein
MGDGTTRRNGHSVNVKNLLALDTQYAISTISTRLRQEDMYILPRQNTFRQAWEPVSFEIPLLPGRNLVPVPRTTTSYSG